MGILDKMTKISNIGVSSIKEKLKCTYLEKNIKNINKKLQKVDDKTAAHLIIKKENIKKSIENEKRNEEEKRKDIKKDLKKQIIISKNNRKKENENLNIIQRVQKEFKEIPITTIGDDLAAGISDIDKAEKLVKKFPKDIYAWLNLAETIKFHKKTFLVITGVKAPLDMIGSAVDIGTEFIGEAIENVFDENKWTYERAINQAIKLGATKEQIEKFIENYKKNMVISTAKGVVHTVCKQSEKLAKTSERILDFAVDKIMTKKNN